MANRNWIDRWRVVVLSASGGLFSSAVYLMVYRVDEYLADLRYREELAREAANPSGFFVCRFDLTNPLWWVNASVWNIVLFLIAGILVHRYLRKRVSSVFFLWLWIGFSVILAWGITVLLGVVLDGYWIKGQFPLERIIGGFVYTSNQITGLKFVAVMLASSVVYGTLMQVAARLYDGKRVQ
jgi:hypothetical protein